MARQFINMYMETNNMGGYYVVEYIDNNGETKKDRFDTDLDAHIFYQELIKERNTPQSQ